MGRFKKVFVIRFKQLRSILFLGLPLMFLPFFGLCSVLAEAGLPVHNVDTGLGYATIQQAVDANDTSNGNTIFVDAGTYHENVVVNKSVALIGADREMTIIDGGGTGDVVRVSSHNVTVSRFTIRNGYVKGIDVSHCDGSKITDNVICGSVGHGIQILNSSRNVVAGNVLYSNWNGLVFQKSSGNVIMDNNVSSNSAQGIVLGTVSDSFVKGNTASDNNWIGVYVTASSNNIVCGNTIFRNKKSGVSVETIEIENKAYASANNTFLNNNISNNPIGIFFARSSNNTFFNNNLVNNTQQVYDERFADETPSANVWEKGLPIGGNYWDNYTGADILGGPNQNEPGSDGIWDTPYIINAHNQDRYPLAGVFSDFNTSLAYYVEVVSNSTIGGFKYFESNSTIVIFVSNMTADQTNGFCRICISHELMDVGSISVVIDNGETEVLYPNYRLFDNGTHRWIYFAYEHSTHEIEIVPEFPSIPVLSTSVMAIVLAVIILSRRRTTSPFQSDNKIVRDVSKIAISVYYCVWESLV